MFRPIRHAERSPIDMMPELRRLPHRLVQNVFLRAATGERRTQLAQLVENAAERPDVGTEVVLVVLYGLGCHKEIRTDAVGAHLIDSRFVVSNQEKKTCN